MCTPCDAPGLIESINERFDSAIEFMLPNTFVFGTALRNLIAGTDPGDTLTILTCHSDHKLMWQAFEASSKWVTRRNNDALVFVNMYGLKVLLVKVAKPDINAYSVIEHSNNLRCNCMVMDHNGQVLEVVPGAYKDCQDKAIYLASEFTSSNSMSLERYVHILTQDGWSNHISRKYLTRKSSHGKVPVRKGVNAKGSTSSALHEAIMSAQQTEPIF